MKHFALALATFALGVAPSLATPQQVTVSVLDTHSAAIPGALIEVRGLAAGALRASAVADASGAARIQCEPPVEIRVSAPGFEPSVEKLEASGSSALTIQLRPATLRTTIDVVVRDAPDVATTSTSVGSALEIDRSGARTVFDAVEKLVPSAFVTRRGVMGYGIATNGTGVVTIRGIGETPNAGVLIVVDGRPDYMGLMGHPLPDFYSLSDAGTVSVTQGPASVLYGSNAMGGVIEVKPKHPLQALETQLASSVGSFWTGQHRLRHAGTLGRNFYSLAVGIDHTNGDRPRSAFRNQDGSLRIGRDLGEAWRLSLDGLYGHFHVEDPGPVPAPLPDSFARVGRGGFSIDLNNAYSRAWGYARFLSNHGRHIIYDGFRSVDSTTGVRLHQHFALTPKLTVEGGSDVVRYGGRANNILSGLDYGEHHITAAAGFSRAQWEASDRWQLNAGFRFQYNSQFGSIPVPEFGASCRLTENYALSAAVGKGFRNPTIRELYLFPAPNPLLRPEHVWNYQTTFQAHPYHSVSTWVTGYYADLSNVIIVTGRFPNLQLSNAGGALNRGFEANLTWRPRRGLAFNSGYAYLRSTNLSPYLPTHKLNYSLDLDLKGRAFLHLGGMTVNRRWADVNRTRQLGGYTLATMKCTIPIRKGLSVFALVDNLLDRRYEVVTGYPMPGINAMGGMDIRF